MNAEVHNTDNLFRKSAVFLKPWDNAYLHEANGRLSKKMAMPSAMSNNQPYMLPWNEMPWQQNERGWKYNNVPSIIAPGQEDAWLESQRQLKKKAQTATSQGVGNVSSLATANDVVEEQSAATQNVGTDGSGASGVLSEGVGTLSDCWSSLLSTTGLDGLSDVTHNLGYIVSMLPDLLFGMFTGKTELKIKDNLIPIASVLLGLFIKNPMLKMLLIGMGGANLFNKAGHEVLDRRSNSQPQYQREGTAPGMSVQYRRYADEPLNPRIQSPMLQGNGLIAVIDHVPCSVALSGNVIEAHRTGALPLNTLANAVLAQYDRQRHMANVAQQRFDSVQRQLQETELGMELR